MMAGVCGLMGGGKSLSCVDWGAQRVARGGTFITDIELCEEGFGRLCRDKYRWRVQAGQVRALPVDPEERAVFHRYLPSGQAGCNVFVVIDEALDFLDCLDHKGTSRELLWYFRQVRKRKVDLYLIAQTFAELNKRARNRCQYVFAMTDLQTERLPHIKLCLHVPMIMQQRFDRTGRAHLGNTYLWKSRLVYEAYNTDQITEDRLPVGEVVGRYERPGPSVQSVARWRVARAAGLAGLAGAAVARAAGVL